MTRLRLFVPALAAAALIACAPEAPAADGDGGAPALASADGDVVVYKSPTCGCCTGWVEHMREAGFDVDARDVDYAELARRRAEAGIPPELGSCHTGSVAGYSIEGHIPAAVIARLVEERPADIRGLVVPGMPTGSPGMEGPNPQPYDVIALRTDGSRVVYETVYPGQPSSDAR